MKHQAQEKILRRQFAVYGAGVLFEQGCISHGNTCPNPNESE